MLGAGVVGASVPTTTKPEVGSVAQGRWKHVLGGTGFYSSQLWSGYPDGAPAMLGALLLPRLAHACLLSFIVLSDPSC